MATCVSSPTLTTTSVGSSASLSTTVTRVVTTAPPTVTTITLTTCTPINTNSSATCIPTATTSVRTVGGFTSTIDEPVTITIQVPFTQIATLYGSSCTTPAGVVISSTSSVTSTLISVSTPPPTVITSQSYTTLSDGSVSTATLTSTSTLPASTISAPPLATQSHGTNIAPIVGGAVGGFVGFAALVLLGWYFIKKKARYDDIFDNDEGYTGPTKNTNSLNPSSQTQGYHYTPVSHTLANPTVHSPPTSPPPQAQAPLASFGNESAFQGHSAAAGGGHHHSPSLTPLLAAGLGAAAGAQTAQLAVNATGGNTNSTASRPSSAGSAQPLVQQGYGQYQGQGQGYAPQNLPPGAGGQGQGYAGHGFAAQGGQQGYAQAGQGYPAAQSQGYAAGQGQGYAAAGQGYTPGQGQGYALGQGQGYAPGQGQGYVPSSALSHTTSTSSAGTTSWGGSSSGGGGGAPIPGIIPVMATTRHRQQTSDPVYNSSNSNRSGSPVSIQEQRQRVLQVSNAGPSSSSMNYPSTADATTMYDGKGRPISLAGEKPALVHLDGGRYEEPSVPTPSRPVGAAPPAYSG